MRVELQYFEGCPHWKLAHQRLACRVYRTPTGLSGSPTTAQLVQALS
jgi:hypothetical protein